MRRQALYVLATAAVVVTIALGIRAAFGLFLKPISQDLQLGREVLSLALAVATLITGLGGPIAGALADRYGGTRVTAVGGVFFVIGLLVASFASGPLGLQASFGILLGIAMTAASLGIAMGAVARAVPPEKRSMAFGIVMSGGSLGQFLVIPYTQWMLGTWDWRVACELLAISAAVIIPLAWGLRDMGTGGKTAPSAAGEPTTFGAALREASGHSGFWLLTASFFVCGFHVSFINTHLPAYLSDRGMSGNVAANALALVGLFNIFGSLASGWIGGRCRQRYLLTSIYLARAAIFVPLLVLPMTPALAMAFSAAMGLLYLSTVPPTSGIVAQVFGPRNFSMLYGIVFGSHQIGGFLGSWLGGYFFDRTGSYDVVWWMSIGLALAAAALSAPIRDEPLRRPAPAAA